MSARTKDLNGYIEIKDNPISKVGIFPYSGKQISSTLDPDKIYQVYRPAEELANQDCIDSFKLIPWIDEHVMLGLAKDGLVDAALKGVLGTTGENARFENGYLKVDLKIFSKELADLIDNDKKELSIGYHSIYEITSGVYNGERYDAIQRKIRGNHLALVGKGRAGPDVAVLDNSIFTYDSMELNEMFKKKEGKVGADSELTLESLAAELKELRSLITSSTKKEAKDEELPETKNEAKDEEADKVKKEAKDEEADKTKTEEADKVKKEAKDEEADKTKTMDEMIKPFKTKLQAVTDELEDLKVNSSKKFFNELSKRNEVAQQLSQYIGVFDHANQTLDEVLQYGITKLGLSAEKGQESAVLSAYLAGRKTTTSAAGTITFDHKNESSCVDKYLNN